MFLLSFLLVGLAIGFWRGGSLSGLADIRLRHAWLILVGLLLQVIAFADILGALPDPEMAARALHLLSYGNCRRCACCSSAPWPTARQS